MRPFWVTYERGGSNGHSRLMDMSLADMRHALESSDLDVPEPPARWGDMRSHVFYGALYHWFVLFRNGDYRNFRPHRDQSVARETWLYTKRLLLMPWIWAGRVIATTRIRMGGWPYHLVLLQLEHDASFRMHSPFTGSRIPRNGDRRLCPRCAPSPPPRLQGPPLENGRSPLLRTIRSLAARHGLAGRVHYVAGGKLARLLDHARTAVTVNSTAGQQVLWRGIPLKVFGAPSMPNPNSSPTAAVRFFPSPAARYPRLPRLPPLSPRNLPGPGRLLLRSVPPRPAPPGRGHDAGRRRPL